MAITVGVARCLPGPSLSREAREVVTIEMPCRARQRCRCSTSGAKESPARIPCRTASSLNLVGHMSLNWVRVQAWAGVVVSDPSEFEAPPVVEVALGVQFRLLPGLRGLALAPLRDQWKDQYPRLEEQPPLPSTVEGNVPGGPVVQLNVGLPSLRYWFLTGDGSELVQLQQDRLSVNWRHTDSGSHYRRYPAMRQTFADRFRDLVAFATREDMGTVRVNQVELNYVNAVNAEATEGGKLERVLSMWNSLSEHHLGRPEQVRMEMSFQIKDLGTGMSRLWVQAGPGTRDSGTGAILLTLSVRGAPLGESLSEILSFMDDAHRHALQSFKELTTPEMHAIWRLRQ